MRAWIAEARRAWLVSCAAVPAVSPMAPRQPIARENAPVMYRQTLAMTSVVCAAAAAGCGDRLTRLATTAAPEQVVLGWFAAENAQDAPLMDAYYPGSSHASPATASHIHCRTHSQGVGQVVVSCSFDASNWDGAGDDEKYSGWTFQLQHSDRLGWQIRDAGYA